MKIKKDKLFESIEDIIADGVIHGEPVDDAAKKVLDIVWPIIQKLQDDLDIKEN